MKTYATKLLVWVLMLFALNGYAQNAKKFYKDGKKELKEEKFDNAISLFSQAIELDANYTDAYLDRAVAYEKLDKKLEAAEDYNKATSLNPKEYINFYHAGRLYHDLQQYEKAVKFLNQSTNLDKKHLESYQTKVKSLIALKKFPDALKESEKTLDIKKTDLNYYHHGVISYNLKNFDKAVTNFEKAIRENSTFEDAYNGLAKSLYSLGKLDDALAISDKVVKLNNNNKESFLIRSMIYHKKADYPNAINDLSLILSNISPDDENIYFLRGEYYQEFNQHQNAINDFCKVLSINEENAMAYYQRAVSYEEISKDQEAVKDYEKFKQNLVANDNKSRKLLRKAKERIYFLSKESNKPVIVITSPKMTKDGHLEVKQDADKIKLMGKVTDESELEYLTFNGKKYVLKPNIVDNTFEIDIDVSDIKQIKIAASDIYHNLQESTYPLLRTEINLPTIHLISPYASDNGEIYLESNAPTLFLEGRVTDESLIKSIFIEGVTASYRTDELNPGFTASVTIANKGTLTVKVEDIFGNLKEIKYTLNRDGAQISADNPMGKTWVIFIENSSYQSFASLDGPAKDVTEMKSAFSNYKIHNVIHKKNMSKAQMERFFSIELRDLVKKQRVNSLIVWYAGHGKFIHETGYWIPVNAMRDDEFTYFNINNLKASMQSYSKFIKHTLVITDACESGPSFYMAMRSDPKERDCGDWQATKFKSSQVFTSAGNELAADKSQFTQTFSNTLKYNPDDCIAIENIVLKVTKAVSETGSQKPRFGKIAGLEDEDGTFFFIKK